MRTGLPASTIRDMNTPSNPLHETAGRNRDRQLDQLIASRNAAESTIAIAMITNCLPGMEVSFINQEIVELLRTGDTGHGSGNRVRGDECTRRVD